MLLTLQYVGVLGFCIFNISGYIAVANRHKNELVALRARGCSRKSKAILEFWSADCANSAVSSAWLRRCAQLVMSDGVVFDAPNFS